MCKLCCPKLEIQLRINSNTKMTIWRSFWTSVSQLHRYLLRVPGCINHLGAAREPIILNQIPETQLCISLQLIVTHFYLFNGVLKLPRWVATNRATTTQSREISHWRCSTGLAERLWLVGGDKENCWLSQLPVEQPAESFFSCDLNK